MKTSFTLTTFAFLALFNSSADALSARAPTRTRTMTDKTPSWSQWPEGERSNRENALYYDGYGTRGRTNGRYQDYGMSRRATNRNLGNLDRYNRVNPNGLYDDMDDRGLIIQGGSTHNWLSGPEHSGCLVYLTTDGLPLKASLEILDRPDYAPVKMKMFSEDGLRFPWIIETSKTINFDGGIENAGKGDTTRIINQGPIEFPLQAEVSPLLHSQRLERRLWSTRDREMQNSRSNRALYSNNNNNDMYNRNGLSRYNTQNYYNQNNAYNRNNRDFRDIYNRDNGVYNNRNDMYRNNYRNNGYRYNNRNDMYGYNNRNNGYGYNNGYNSAYGYNNGYGGYNNQYSRNNRMSGDIRDVFNRNDVSKYNSRNGMWNNNRKENWKYNNSNDLYRNNNYRNGYGYNNGYNNAYGGYNGYNNRRNGDFRDVFNRNDIYASRNGDFRQNNYGYNNNYNRRGNGLFGSVKGDYAQNNYYNNGDYRLGTSGLALPSSEASFDPSVMGNTRRTFRVEPGLDQVRISLQTPEGRPMMAEVEVWEGPGTTKQFAEIYTKDGRPFSTIVNTPRSGAVIGVRNAGPMAYPLEAFVESVY